VSGGAGLDYNGEGLSRRQCAAMTPERRSGTYTARVCRRDEAPLLDEVNVVRGLYLLLVGLVAGITVVVMGNTLGRITGAVLLVVVALWGWFTAKGFARQNTERS
jgi:hypothetical protein